VEEKTESLESADPPLKFATDADAEEERPEEAAACNDMAVKCFLLATR
jgi:hypothetical protein